MHTWRAPIEKHLQLLRIQLNTRLHVPLETSKPLWLDACRVIQGGAKAVRVPANILKHIPNNFCSELCCTTPLASIWNRMFLKTIMTDWSTHQNNSTCTVTAQKLWSYLLGIILKINRVGNTAVYMRIHPLSIHRQEKIFAGQRKKEELCRVGYRNRGMNREGQGKANTNGWLQVKKNEIVHLWLHMSASMDCIPYLSMIQNVTIMENHINMQLNPVFLCLCTCQEQSIKWYLEMIWGNHNTNNNNSNIIIIIIWASVIKKTSYLRKRVFLIEHTRLSLGVLAPLRPRTVLSVF